MRRAFIIAAACLALLVTASPAAAIVQTTALAAGTSDSALVASDASTRPRQLRWFCGFSVMETAGAAAATVRFYNGDDATGELLFSVSLLASESRSEGPWEKGQCIRASDGIFVDRGGTGTPEVVVFWRLEAP